MRWMCGRGQQLQAGEEGKAKRRLWEGRPGAERGPREFGRSGGRSEVLRGVGTLTKVGEARAGGG